MYSFYLSACIVMGETYGNSNRRQRRRWYSRVVLLFLIFNISFPHRCYGDGTPTVEVEVERTLAMIKPDGVAGNYTYFIRNTILASGFTIHKEFTLQLPRHTAKEFYADHSSRSFFPALINYITSGPVLIMVLDKVNAVSDWRALIGPTDASKAKVTHPHSIRAKCGVSLQRNCVHGSDSTVSAAREISFFFKERNPGENVSEHDEL